MATQRVKTIILEFVLCGSLRRRRRSRFIQERAATTQTTPYQSLKEEMIHIKT